MRADFQLSRLGLLLVLAVASPAGGEELARGLKLSLLDAAAPELRDARPSRLAALFVPAGASPSPFLPAGRFVARFEGYVELPLNDWFVFEVQGRGGVTLRLHGETLIHAELTETGPRAASREVDLRKGSNPIELVLESPMTGPAELRLLWRNDTVRLEPLPPEALSHDVDAELSRGAERRRGRELFAAGRCHRCHHPQRPIDPDSMPELTARAPSLEGLGARLRRRWIRDWLRSPADLRPGAEMPVVLVGDGESVARRAADLAAFLAARGDPGGDPKRPFQKVDPSRGAELYRELGCFVCHDSRLEESRSIPARDSPGLDTVRGRWRPFALVEYLQQPARSHPFTRMPDFGLDRDEAEALASHLWAASEPLAEEASEAEAHGDAEAGAELYAALLCDACHDPRAEAAAAASSLSALTLLAQRVVDGEEPRPEGGCWSDSPRAGPSPWYPANELDRHALWRFLARDLDSLWRRAPAEASERLYRRLRCSACHFRDTSGDLWSEQISSEAVPTLENGGLESNVHDARPALTWAGEKLRPEWLRRLLAGELPYRTRPQLRARMPTFRRYARSLAIGLAAQHGLPPRSPPSGPLAVELAEIGSQLVQVDRLGCFACHGLGDEAALATEAQQETINFRYVPDRLRRSFYDRFLLDPQRVLPGSMMPTFVDPEGRSPITSILDGDARRQFDAIWHLMLSLSDASAEDLR